MAFNLFADFGSRLDRLTSLPAEKAYEATLALGESLGVAAPRIAATKFP
jgi:hypothetical protein